MGTPGVPRGRAGPRKQRLPAGRRCARGVLREPMVRTGVPCVEYVCRSWYTVVAFAVVAVGNGKRVYTIGRTPVRTSGIEPIYTFLQT